MSSISVEIEQHGGSKWPGVGDTVVMDGQPYRVEATNGRIHIDGGRPNRMYAEVESIDWDDVLECEECPHTVRLAKPFPSVGDESRA